MAELGGFHDCEAELDAARYLLATSATRGEAIARLQRLFDFITLSVDPKVRTLSPAVKALLESAICVKCGVAAKSRDVGRSGARAGSWSRWMWRFSDSFLHQWEVLLQHFLLVMSVLIFT